MTQQERVRVLALEKLVSLLATGRTMQSEEVTAGYLALDTVKYLDTINTQETI